MLHHVLRADAPPLLAGMEEQPKADGVAVSLARPPHGHEPLAEVHHLQVRHRDVGGRGRRLDVDEQLVLRRRRQRRSRRRRHGDPRPCPRRTAAEGELRRRRAARGPRGHADLHGARGLLGRACACAARCLRPHRHSEVLRRRRRILLRHRALRAQHLADRRPCRCPPAGRDIGGRGEQRLGRRRQQPGGHRGAAASERYADSACGVAARCRADPLSEHRRLRPPDAPTDAGCRSVAWAVQRSSMILS
mmetsp:Transcript_123796/g.358085  ORF Transcript_123796/g.358085 Transcript_123796/m.358085 type:complete len:248 (+) Transcript_123796:345-1088(+)